MDRYFITRLLIPLLVAFAISVGLHLWLNWDGFFLNLTTELIGIVLTVAYVDLILKRRDAQRWEIPQARVASRLRLFVDRSMNACLQSLRYEYKTFDKSKVIGLSNDKLEASMHAEIVRVARETLMIEALLRIDAFGTEDWKNFGAHMQSISHSAERLLLAFGDRLSPEQYTLLLDIQETTERTRFTWSTVPYLADDAEQGVFKRVLSERTVFDLQNLLQMLEELYATAA
jgi:hypothetical protein